MAGRPTKYTPETVEEILDGIATGLTDKDAALAVGVCEKTLERWRKRYADFDDRLMQARAQRSHRWLGGIRAAAPNDWRAYAELLDRCAPEYRKVNKHEHGGPDGGAIPITGIAIPLPVAAGDEPAE